MPVFHQIDCNLPAEQDKLEVTDMINTEPERIQIGSFGQLDHDSLNYTLTDTYQTGATTAVRIIDLPKKDFFLLSGDNIIYFWSESKEVGTWYGSEKTRLEREKSKPILLEDDNYWQQQAMNCSHDDHPEGCLARAVQAGFGCIVYEE